MRPAASVIPVVSDTYAGADLSMVPAQYCTVLAYHI